MKTKKQIDLTEIFALGGNLGVGVIGALLALAGTHSKLIYFNKLEKGGQFAAWEQPELFSAEARAGFAPLRSRLTAKN